MQGNLHVRLYCEFWSGNKIIHLLGSAGFTVQSTGEWDFDIFILDCVGSLPSASLTRSGHMFTHPSLCTIPGQQLLKVRDLRQPQTRALEMLVPSSQQYNSIGNKASYSADWSFQLWRSPRSLTYHMARIAVTTVCLHRWSIYGPRVKQLFYSHSYKLETLTLRL
jgi:hypothetical protein